MNDETNRSIDNRVAQLAVEAEEVSLVVGRASREALHALVDLRDELEVDEVRRRRVFALHCCKNMLF